MREGIIRIITSNLAPLLNPDRTKEGSRAPLSPLSSAARDISARLSLAEQTALGAAADLEFGGLLERLVRYIALELAGENQEAEFVESIQSRNQGKTLKKLSTILTSTRYMISNAEKAALTIASKLPQTSIAEIAQGRQKAIDEQLPLSYDLIKSDEELPPLASSDSRGISPDDFLETLIKELQAAGLDALGTLGRLKEDLPYKTPPLLAALVKRFATEEIDN
jgi:hypothetical protein